MNKKIIAISVSVVALIGVFIFGALKYKESERQRLGFLADENIKLFYPDHSPVIGAKDAKVILTEFLDPECESCRMFAPKVKGILKMYEGKVKLVVRYAAFHKNSAHAIKVLEATRKQGKFAESLSYLFQNQPAWASHHNPKPLLVFKFLAQLGLDIDQIKKDMLDPKIQETIEKDTMDMKLLKVRGTPTFFVNGKPLEQFSLGHLYTAINKAVLESYPKE